MKSTIQLLGYPHGNGNPQDKAVSGIPNWCCWHDKTCSWFFFVGDPFWESISGVDAYQFLRWLADVGENHPSSILPLGRCFVSACFITRRLPCFAKTELVSDTLYPEKTNRMNIVVNPYKLKEPQWGKDHESYFFEHLCSKMISEMFQANAVCLGLHHGACLSGAYQNIYRRVFHSVKYPIIPLLSMINQWFTIVNQAKAFLSPWWSHPS